jgi:hypothetical protein
MGIKKLLLCAGGLILAAGGPVTFYTASDIAGNAKRLWTGASAMVASPQQPDKPAETAAPTASLPAEGASPSMPSPPNSNTIVTPSLDEVFRFDVTVEWIMQRWPRVSTGLPYPKLQGYRVPLVTGTSLGDVAGSLTYYFNAQQRVERIAFRGTTGDPGMLVNLLTTKHRFIRRLTNDPGLVLYESVDSDNHPAGVLRIRSARVVKVDQPYSRFEIELMMDRAE